MNRYLPTWLLFCLALPLVAEEPVPPEYKPIEQLKTYQQEGPDRKAGSLGLVYDKASQQFGCQVVTIRKDSVVEAAGIERGDVIVVFDRIRSTSAGQLSSVVRSKKAGETVDVVLFRAGQKKTVTLTFKAAARTVQALGMRVKAPVAATSAGVPISRVMAGGPGAKAGLQAGDVITAFGGTPTPHKEVLGRLASSLLAGDKVELTIERGEQTRQVTVLLEAQRPRRRRGPGQPAVRRAFKLAVLLVEFADKTHDPRFKAADFERLIFSRKTYTGKSPTGATVYGSVADYYHEVSNGVFALTGTVFDWVAVASNKDDWRNKSGKEGKALIRDAMQKVLARDGRRAFSGYQGLAVIYAGRVEHPRGRALWPHRSTVQLRVDGRRKRLPFYIVSEQRGKSAGFSGITIHSHEFGHMLGLPDQYSMLRNKGMDLGVWCLMARSHRRKEGGHRPVHLCAWCKVRAGWLEPTTIDPRSSQKIALRPVEGNAVQCIKVPLRSAANEYLLLSYRHHTGFDKTLPRAGLLIWHVSAGKQVDLLEAHGQGSSRKRLREIPFPLPRRSSLIVDERLRDLKTSPTDRWKLRIHGIRELAGRAMLLEVGPLPENSK